MSLLPPEGLLLVDKPLHITSFGVIATLRRLTGVQKIGHCGTLDPLASGLLVCLIGKKFTKLSDTFLGATKTYLAKLTLGSSTTTYDQEGTIEHTSTLVPSLEALEKALESFQGTTLQMPPLFCAKKVGGRKACDAARAGQTVELTPQQVTMNLKLISYHYPVVELHISSSKGTYIRSLAHDLGNKLGCFAHLKELRRVQSGSFSIDEAIPLSQLKLKPELIRQHLKT